MAHGNQHHDPTFDSTPRRCPACSRLIDFRAGPWQTRPGPTVRGETMLLLHLLGGLTDEEVDIIVAEELDLLANGEERSLGPRTLVRA